MSEIDLTKLTEEQYEAVDVSVLREHCMARVSRAKAVNALLSSEAVKELRTSFRQCLMDRWATTPVSNQTERENFYHTLKVWDALFYNMDSTVRDGIAATAQAAAVSSPEPR